MSELRPFQQQFVTVALDKVMKNEPTLVANVHPGSGKTIGALLAVNELIKFGVADIVVVFVPRRNLAEQFEQDSRKFQNSFTDSALKSIEHRENEPPLLRGQSNGYVTTYASLASAPSLHLDIFKRYAGRIILVCDEAQQLGADYDGVKVTRSATLIEELMEYAALTIVMTGTPYRADNTPILGASYSDPDSEGKRYLRPDIEATYRVGVRGGYLRQFEAELFDGRAIWKRMGFDPEELVLSQLDKAIYRVIRHPDYWQPLLDRFADLTEERRRLVDPRLVSLVAAYDQIHAKEISDYMRKRHGHLKTLIAVSEDGEEAQYSLRQFKRGKHDILITVNMAYVGYDYKPISQILPLTGYRSSGYLRQLIARGLRVMGDIPFEEQFCYVVAPNDVEMSVFVEELRTESRAAIKEREQTISPRPSNESKLNPFSPGKGHTEQAWVTDAENKGLDPEGDLSGETRSAILEVLQEARISPPPAAFYTAVQKFNQRQNEMSQTTSADQPLKTQREREKEARQHLENLTRTLDGLLGAPFGTTNRDLYKIFRKSVTECTLDEIQQRIDLVQRWLDSQAT